MRRVEINGAPPADWVVEADELTRKLRAAVTEEAREAIIEKHKGVWTDERIRDWLLQQFHNKCWYSESRESVSSIHVDHYRPKNAIRDEVTRKNSEGYWWLAFEWTNYRICGQLLNVKKGALFPIIEGRRATHDEPLSLQLEAPTLIDPTTDQTRLISYEKQDGGDCLAIVAAGTTHAADRLRAEWTIQNLGLNKRPRLNQHRCFVWDQCLQKIQEYLVEGKAYVLRQLLQEEARKALQEMVSYKAEFSSVAEACLRKHGPPSLIAAVFGR
jgi:hypothetical protein